MDTIAKKISAFFWIDSMMTIDKSLIEISMSASYRYSKIVLNIVILMQFKIWQILFKTKYIFNRKIVERNRSKYKW